MLFAYLIIIHSISFFLTETSIFLCIREYGPIAKPMVIVADPTKSFSLPGTSLVCNTIMAKKK